MAASWAASAFANSQTSKRSGFSNGPVVTVPSLRRASPAKSAPLATTAERRHASWRREEPGLGTKNGDRVELIQVDDAGLLFISPAITDWRIVDRHSVDTVIDLDGALDDGVPTAPDHLLYVYFPILDQDLPNLAKLHAVAALGATLVRERHCVLSHCGLGFNRSALLAG